MNTLITIEIDTLEVTNNSYIALKRQIPYMDEDDQYQIVEHIKKQPHIKRIKIQYRMATSKVLSLNITNVKS